MNNPLVTGGQYETNEVIKEGWLHTGDIGEFDQNNYLKII